MNTTKTMNRWMVFAAAAVMAMGPAMAQEAPRKDEPAPVAAEEMTCPSGEACDWADAREERRMRKAPRMERRDWDCEGPECEGPECEGPREMRGSKGPKGPRMERRGMDCEGPECEGPREMRGRKGPKGPRMERRDWDCEGPECEGPREMRGRKGPKGPRMERRGIDCECQDCECGPRFRRGPRHHWDDGE